MLQQQQGAGDDQVRRLVAHDEDLMDDREDLGGAQRLCTVEAGIEQIGQDIIAGLLAPLVEPGCEVMLELHRQPRTFDLLFAADHATQRRDRRVGPALERVEVAARQPRRERLVDEQAVALMVGRNVGQQCIGPWLALSVDRLDLFVTAGEARPRLRREDFGMPQRFEDVIVAAHDEKASSRHLINGRFAA